LIQRSSDVSTRKTEMRGVINISMRLQSKFYNDMFDSNLVSVPAKRKKKLNRTRMMAVINYHLHHE
jgi:hypothetical protein